MFKLYQHIISNFLKLRRIKPFGHRYMTPARSGLPFAISIAVLATLIDFVAYMHLGATLDSLYFGALAILAYALVWFSLLVVESISNQYTRLVKGNLILGFIFFLTSETMLFLSFFAGLGYAGTSRTMSTGVIFPPLGIITPDLKLPLIGTGLLLTSAATLSWLHKLYTLPSYATELWDTQNKFTIITNGFMMDTGSGVQVIRSALAAIKVRRQLVESEATVSPSKAPASILETLTSFFDFISVTFINEVIMVILDVLSTALSGISLVYSVIVTRRKIAFAQIILVYIKNSLALISERTTQLKQITHNSEVLQAITGFLAIFFENIAVLIDMYILKAVIFTIFKQNNTTYSLGDISAFGQNFLTFSFMDLLNLVSSDTTASNHSSLSYINNYTGLKYLKPALDNESSVNLGLVFKSFCLSQKDSEARTYFTLFGWLKESREIVWCIGEIVSTSKTLVYLPILSRVSGNQLKLHTLKSILFSITVTLGIFFIVLQTMEYLYSPVTISDSVYGSYFFLLTGFHGLHVIIGLAFLLVSYSRHILMHYGQQIKTHSVGLTTSIWYWHFVDVIWLLLFLVVYLWLDSSGFSLDSLE